MISELFCSQVSYKLSQKIDLRGQDIALAISNYSV